MSSQVDTGNGPERPTWNYRRPKTGNKWEGYDKHTLEMLESARNVLEDIQKSQMLQCDVAHAIKDIAKTLRRIDRRMSQTNPIK